MKVVFRATNSSLITAALLAVIIGSLCFSVGEGLRLTPFPLLSQTQDSGVDLSSSTPSSISKYGPLDVPTQTQKRGKRNVVDIASGSRVATAPVLVSVVCSSEYDAGDLNHLTLSAPPPGRAPPFQS